MIHAFKTGKTPGIILAEIRMLSSAFKGCFFLVEGQDDLKFWLRYLSRVTAMIVDCQGKPNLLGAVDRIITANFPPFTGVYDTDFDRLNGKRHHPTVLATTDQNDLELSLVASEALDEFLREFGVRRKLLILNRKTS